MTSRKPPPCCKRLLLDGGCHVFYLSGATHHPPGAQTPKWSLLENNAPLMVGCKKPIVCKAMRCSYTSWTRDDRNPHVRMATVRPSASPAGNIPNKYRGAPKSSIRTLQLHGQDSYLAAVDHTLTPPSWSSLNPEAISVQITCRRSSTWCRFSY